MSPWTRALLAGFAAVSVIAIAVPCAGILLLLTVGPHSGLLTQRHAEAVAPVLAAILLAAVVVGAMKVAQAVLRRSSGTRASPD